MEEIEDTPLQVHVTLLGPIEVRIGAALVTVPGRRQRGILAALALHPGRIVATDSLIKAVWDESPPRTATGQIHTGIWKLRGALIEAGGSAEVVDSCSPGYRLNAEHCSVDVAEYRMKIASARDLSKSGGLEEAVKLLRSADDLWRGPALADVTHQGLRTSATQLEEERYTALRYRLSLELILERHEEVVAELYELIDRFPLRENLYADLMLALYRSGRQADALRVFHRVRQTLATELGIDPGPTLRALEQAILSQDSALMPA